MVNSGTNSGKAAFAAALTAAVAGGSVLSGWIFDLEYLKSVAPGLVAMNPASASAFVLAGISLAFFLWSPHGRFQGSNVLVLAARASALLVALIGLSKLTGIMCGWNCGVDQWIFASKLANGLAPPNRMSPNSALNFLLLGSALLLVDVKKRSVRLYVEIAGGIIGFGSLLVILGYAYGIPLFYRFGSFKPMALHAAITFSILSVGLLLSHTDSGLPALLAGDSRGGQMARRLLPVAILFPALLGWLSRLGERAGINASICDAVQAVGNILVFAFLICWSAQRLFNADHWRRKAEEAKRESEESFSIAFEHAPIGVALLSPEGRWLKVNQALCDLVGYSKVELLARTFQDITPPGETEIGRETMRRLLTGETRSCELQKHYVHRRGHLVAVSINISLVRDGQDQPRYFIAQTQDITERKRVEAALEESRSRYRSLFEHMLEGYVRCQLLYEEGRAKDYVYLEVNSTFEPLTGLKNVVGKKVSEVVPGMHENNPEQLEIYGRVAATGIPEKFEAYAKGLGIWFSVSVYSHEKEHFVAVFDNITERKRAEAGLRFDQQRYRSLVEATTAIVWDTPASGEFVVEQPGWTALTGQSFEELRGWGWLKAIHPDDRAETGRVWSAALASRSIYEVEHRLRARDGTYRNMMVRAVPVLAEGGTIHQWIGIHTDITERKQAEAWRLQLAAIIESSEDAIASKDLDSNVTSWNAAAEKMFGYAAREIVGTSIRRLVPPDRQAEEDRIMSSIRRGEPVLHFETVRLTKAGRLIDVSVTVSPIRDAAGIVVGASKIARDITEQKRAEAELRWKTAFLEAQVNSSLDGVLVVDGKGKKLLQNQRFTDLLKIPQQIVDDSDDEEQLLWIVGMTKDPAAFIVKVAHLNSHPDKSSRDEIELRDGTFLDRYSAPVVGSDGTHFGRIWTFRDITERTRSEALLLESQQRLVLATESAGIGIWDWNVVENEMVWDARMLALYGLRPQDFSGAVDAWQKGLHPEDRERAEAEIAVALAGPQDFRSEFRVVWPSGEVREIQAYAVVQRATDGSARRMVGVNWDVTARKRTEARYRRLVESNVQGILFWTATGGITGANDAYLSLIGYSREDLESRRIDWVALTPPEYAHLDRRALEEIAATGTSALYEKELIRKDGSRVPILLGSTAFEDNPNEGVCFVVDLTERKRLETQLVQSQKLETVGKLAGGIAHEFNSILTAIIGQSELLLADLPSGSPLAANATEITKAAGRAAALTRQLLAYGRKQLLQPEVLDLSRVITRMEGVLRHLMGVNIDMRIVATSRLNAVKADAGQLEQVITQMAINARDAMPNGGKFTLETANVSFDQESVSNYPELKPGDYVMLAITDNGQGMSAEVKARAFEPFFSTKGVGEGTGLGLSTCYGIIKQSGGHISVYSELAGGATFKIYLPQVERSATVLSRRPTPADLPCGTETILLVEDDPALREMASGLLRRLGYAVLAAANGVEAMSLQELRGREHVDLLFTDLVMPHMNGKELADRVRALYPHTRILFTSAYTENAIVHQDVLDKGAALLQKPFMPSALARKVREVLDQPNDEGAGPHSSDE